MNQLITMDAVRREMDLARKDLSQATEECQQTHCQLKRLLTQVHELTFTASSAADNAQLPSNSCLIKEVEETSPASQTNRSSPIHKVPGRVPQSLPSLHLNDFNTIQALTAVVEHLIHIAELTDSTYNTLQHCPYPLPAALSACASAIESLADAVVSPSRPVSRLTSNQHVKKSSRIPRLIKGRGKQVTRIKKKNDGKQID